MPQEHDCKSVNTRVDNLEKWADKHDVRCDERSKEIWRRLDGNSRVLYIGMGIVIALEFIGLSGLFQ